MFGKGLCKRVGNLTSRIPLPCQKVIIISTCLMIAYYAPGSLERKHVQWLTWGFGSGPSGYLPEISVQKWPKCEAS